MRASQCVQDDFYITPQLAVMETTNSVFNQTLFQLYLTPKSALSWQRAYIANGFAASATEWTDLFAMYNSGTYNNQVRTSLPSPSHIELCPCARAALPHMHAQAIVCVVIYYAVDGG